jgi:hypothetical protein
VSELSAIKLHDSEPSATDSHFSLPIAVVPEVAVVLPLKCLTLLHVATIDDTEGNSAPEAKIPIELALTVAVDDMEPSDNRTL